MNPIDTWIDTDEVRRLAERLMSPERQAPAIVRESGFNDSFEGFADVSQITPPAVSSPAPAAKIAPPAIQPAVTSVTLPKPALENPLATSAEFSALAGSLHKDHGASAVFMINQDGSVLHDEGCAHLHFAARGMALNWKLGDSANPVRLLIHAGSYLELIPVSRSQGRLILGMIVTQPVSLPTLAAIREKASRA